MTSAFHLWADALLDRLARLDDLYEHAQHRATASLAPILQRLRHDVAHHAERLLATVSAGPGPETLQPIEAAVRTLHRRLDHLCGSVSAFEGGGFLDDVLGNGPGTAPPVIVGDGPDLGHSRFAERLYSLHLPRMYQDTPLAWTHLAGELGGWLCEHLQLTGETREPRARNWLEVRVADRLAVRLLGPAYAFARLQVDPGSWLGAFGGGVGPGAGTRLHWVLSDVAAAGFDVPALAGLRPLVTGHAGDDPGPEAFATSAAHALAAIDDLAAMNRFTHGQWQSATALVADLVCGLPISAAPRPPKSDQLSAWQAFDSLAGRMPGTAGDLLAVLADQPNSAATIVNAGWLHRHTLGTDWLDEACGTSPSEALSRYRSRAGLLDQLLRKSLETATLHRLMQEAP